MWRGYGSTAGVGIVINPEPIYSETDALHAYTYPMLYLSSAESKEMFRSATDGIIKNEQLLAAQSADDVERWVFHMLYSMPFCLKHPGFREEREWRIVYRPNYAKSDRLKPRMESVSGLPQRLYELPLEDVAEEGLVGMAPAQLINRVIIGPTEHGAALHQAFVDLLDEAGVEEPQTKVSWSDIPFR